MVWWRNVLARRFGFVVVVATLRYSRTRQFPFSVTPRNDILPCDCQICSVLDFFFRSSITGLYSVLVLIYEHSVVAMLYQSSP